MHLLTAATTGVQLKAEIIKLPILIIVLNSEEICSHCI